MAEKSARSGSETAQAQAAEAQSRNGESGRRSWGRFFVEEWSLLLLAAGMTLTSWLIVREQVVGPHVIKDVWVELAVDSGVADRLGAVFTAESHKIDVRLECSEREKNEAVQAMLRSGRPTVTLRISQIPRTENRPFNTGDDTYDWPFDAQRILRRPYEPPTGRVFRLSKKRASIATPQTARTPEQLEADEGIKVDIRPEIPSFEMDVPEGVFEVDQPLVPDKVHIDPQEFKLQDGSYGPPRPITLTFETWRAQDDSEPWRKAYRAQMKLPPIKAMVTLTSVSRRAVENNLRVLADEEAFEFDKDELRLRHKTITGLQKLMYTGTLTGPKQVLDELEQAKDMWSWGIKLTQDPEAKLLEDGIQPDGDGWYSLEGEFVWLPYALPDGGFQNRGVRYERQEGEAVTVTIRFKRRKKP